MNAVLDFIRGIAPWVIPAILLVLFAISAAAKDKTDTDLCFQWRERYGTQSKRISVDTLSNLRRENKDKSI